MESIKSHFHSPRSDVKKHEFAVNLWVSSDSYSIGPVNTEAFKVFPTKMLMWSGVITVFKAALQEACLHWPWMSVLSASMSVVSAEFDDPSALVVLAEEELVVIDLKSAGWPAVHPPYLASLHCSAITCSHHVSNIPLKLWERIISAGSKQNFHYSSMVWQLCVPLCVPTCLGQCDCPG